MNKGEWLIFIGLSVLAVMVVAAVIYSRFHVGKDDEFAVGVRSDKDKRDSRKGQFYTFTTPDGKTYTASLPSNRAKIKGFFDYEYPDEVLIRYNKNNPQKHVVLKKK